MILSINLLGESVYSLLEQQPILRVAVHYQLNVWSRQVINFVKTLFSLHVLHIAFAAHFYEVPYTLGFILYMISSVCYIILG